MIEESKLKKYNNYLCSIQTKVLSSLQILCQDNASTELKYKILKTFDSWLDLNKSLETNKDLLNNKVVRMAFENINEVELSDVCSYVISNTIKNAHIDNINQI